MIKNRAKPTRVDVDWEKEMKDMIRIRIERRLSKINPRENSVAEMTRLMRRTVSWPNVLEELKTKPKKK